MLALYKKAITGVILQPSTAKWDTFPHAGQGGQGGICTMPLAHWAVVVLIRGHPIPPGFIILTPDRGPGPTSGGGIWCWDSSPVSENVPPVAQSVLKLSWIR